MCLAWFAVDAVALDLAQSHRLPEGPCLRLLGLALGQVSLMAGLLVWGRSDLMLRLGGLIASIAIWSWMLATLQLDAAGWMRHLMAHAMLVTAALATERSWRTLKNQARKRPYETTVFALEYCATDDLRRHDPRHGACDFDATVVAGAAGGRTVLLGHGRTERRERESLAQTTTHATELAAAPRVGDRKSVV